jgi:hypothetical protein
MNGRRPEGRSAAASITGKMNQLKTVNEDSNEKPYNFFLL